MNARFRLWQLTGNAVHLEEARRLLDFLVEHAPEEDRESMVKNVPLYREIRLWYGAWRQRSMGSCIPMRVRSGRERANRGDRGSSAWI